MSGKITSSCLLLIAIVLSASFLVNQVIPSSLLFYYEKDFRHAGIACDDAREAMRYAQARAEKRTASIGAANVQLLSCVKYESIRSYLLASGVNAKSLESVRSVTKMESNLPISDLVAPYEP